MQTLLIILTKMERADIFVFNGGMVNKKISGFFIISLFVLLSFLILLNKSIVIQTIGCLVYNVLTIICVLIWNSSIPVIEIRKNVVSAILWYWLLWYALFTSVKVLIIN